MRAATSLARLVSARAVLIARALAVVAATLALAPAPAAASTPASRPAWRLPVAGEVSGAFTYDERRPFAPHRRRGVDLRAAPDAVVRAACSGEVSHAGRVPLRGLGVTVRCGRLTATHLGLGALGVRAGERVRRGRRLGRVGPAGIVRLGARVTVRRFGWIDPLRLVGALPPG